MSGTFLGSLPAPGDVQVNTPHTPPMPGPRRETACRSEGLGMWFFDNNSVGAKGKRLGRSALLTLEEEILGFEPEIPVRSRAL